MRNPAGPACPTDQGADDLMGLISSRWTSKKKKRGTEKEKGRCANSRPLIYTEASIGLSLIWL